jgi:hypothetical protein
MTKQEFKQLIIEAHFRGSNAFKDGKTCVPALDREFENSVRVIDEAKLRIRLCKEWIHGYTVAMTTPVYL